MKPSSEGRLRVKWGTWIESQCCRGLTPYTLSRQLTPYWCCLRRLLLKTLAKGIATTEPNLLPSNINKMARGTHNTHSARVRCVRKARENELHTVSMKIARYAQWGATEWQPQRGKRLDWSEGWELGTGIRLMVWFFSPPSILYLIYLSDLLSNLGYMMMCI